MTRRGATDSPVEAAFVLLIGFFGMLLIGVVAVAADGRFGRSAVLVPTCLLVAFSSAIAEPLAATVSPTATSGPTTRR